MDYLWSPWRMAYIQELNKHNGCVFCDALEQTDGPENLIVFRGKWSFVILNRYPYTSGHLMVLPYDHQSDLSNLKQEARAEIMELTSKATEVVGNLFRPQGFNIGINQGDAAGAGIAPHIHIHIVPRWMGDTNFMTTVSKTRVVPEALADTWCKVSEAWEK